MWPLDKLKQIAISKQGKAKNAPTPTEQDRENEILHLRDLFRLSLRIYISEEEMEDYRVQFAALGATDMFYQIYLENCLAGFEHRMGKLKKEEAEYQEKLDCYAHENTEELNRMSRKELKHYNELLAHYANSLKSVRNSQAKIAKQMEEIKKQLAQLEKPQQSVDAKIVTDEPVPQTAAPKATVKVAEEMTAEITR